MGFSWSWVARGGRERGTGLEEFEKGWKDNGPSFEGGEEGRAGRIEDQTEIQRKIGVRREIKAQFRIET